MINIVTEGAVDPKFLTADDVQQNKIHFSFAHRAVDIGAVGLEA